jgi:OmcA/MtrC family decaheme c-type cytochrome
MRRTPGLSGVLRFGPLVAGLIVLILVGGAVMSGDTSDRDVTFVRPGLSFTITGANIASDNVLRVRFKIADPKGLPLDRLGVYTPGAISVSFVAAYIPKGASQYVSYTTRAQTSPITGVTAVQASGDSGGSFEQISEGEYQYTFGTKLPASYDKTATHTIAAYGSRNLDDVSMGRQYADTVFHFVPDGSKVGQVRDVIKTATCNRCHYDMGFHGGSRKSMEVCVVCHTPQSVDPDTGNSVDMPVMAHKIHMGVDLPSVKAGKKYIIIGNSQSVNDYSDIAFPDDPRHCTACHEQGKAAQAANVYKPSSAACGACHDNVNFKTGENHVNLPASDAQCANCHVKQGELEFDASIIGAHTIPRFSKELKGVVFGIESVTGAGPGKKPTITFTVKDAKGNPIAPKDMSRLSFRIAGSTSDYTTLISETALTAEGSNGRYFWTTAAALPATAKGTWGISIEGRKDVTIMAGTTQSQTVRDTGLNKTFFFSVDGSTVAPRRTVVSSDKCNACHGAIAFHGDARNTVENCAFCHNPTATAGTGAAATPIQFALFAHRIHAGKELSREYKIGNTSFNDVGYPGALKNCAACHVNGSEQLPLKAGMSNVTDPNGPINPLPPATAACSGCHDSIDAAAHMLANTTRLGESCTVCHGPNAEQSVANAHK